MKRVARIAIVLITVLGCIGCDQTTKAGARILLKGHSPISFLGGLLNFMYAENAGAMLNLGHSFPVILRFTLFVVMVGIFLAAATAALFVKRLDKISVFALSLLVGGGIGNLIDRIVHSGLVVDFMLVKMGPLRTGIFNVADVAITVGVIILFLSLAKSDRGNT
jgi:signal peptidase II